MAEDKPSFVTTNTGRILRVDAANAAASDPAPPVDPARREDVLFRVRREQGHEMSAWWPIAAFLATSGLVILLLGWVPGGA